VAVQVMVLVLLLVLERQTKATRGVVKQAAYRVAVAAQVVLAKLEIPPELITVVMAVLAFLQILLEVQ
jgi:hypothetical protein